MSGCVFVLSNYICIYVTYRNQHSYLLCKNGNFILSACKLNHLRFTFDTVLYSSSIQSYLNMAYLT